MILILFPFWVLGEAINAQAAVKHFTFFSRNREGILDSSFYLHPGITGAQITYPWKKLEPLKDQYDFSEIEYDLNFLSSHGKKLFIQIQDVSFDSNFVLVPKYLLKDTIYHGGVNSQYEVDSVAGPIKSGWVSRRWDPAVANRFHQLLKKLAESFDGRIEGINLPETSVEFPDIPGLVPEGFSPESYLTAVKQNMRALRIYFKKSIPIQYANFMPRYSRKNIKELYKYAEEIKIGMGGPDIKVYRWAQMENSYPLISNISGKVATGVAVQEGNYSLINPKTGKQVTIQEILEFATNYLKLTYIFWYNEEPYYSKEVLPMLRSLK